MSPDDQEGRDDRERVAVLGGGAGGIAAAYELTATKALRDRFAVTVYTPGWRLGGKGASGRDGHGRIEEHGLHIWFGFYRNSFRVLNECLKELHSPPADRARAAPASKYPYKNSGEAFTDCEQLVLSEPVGTGGYRSFCVPLPAGRPGDPEELGDWVLTYMVEWLRLIKRSLIEPLPGHAAAPDEIDLALAELELIAEQAEAPDLRGIRAPSITGMIKAHSVMKVARGLRKAERRAREMAQGLPPGPALDLAHVFDLFKAFAAVVAERVIPMHDHGDRAPFDHLNALEFRTALSGVGIPAGTDRQLRRDLEELRDDGLLISRDTADAAIVRVFYDLAFAYERGEAERPRLAAGVGIENILCMAFLHKGRLMRKMNSGMGDAIFSPLYEVLEGREDSQGRPSVRFEFFNWVSGVKGSPGSGGKPGAVDEITLTPQVPFDPKKPYAPPFSKTDPPRWASGPDQSQFDDDTRKKLSNEFKSPHRAGLSSLAFEREADPLKLGLAQRKLEREKDFDHVVLAIPMSAHEIAAKPLVDSERHRNAFANSASTRTQALQLWLMRDFSDLGWPCGGPKRDRIAGGHAKPFDTCSDMTHLLKDEGWTGPGAPKALAYLCGVMDDRSGEDHRAADVRAGANALDFVKSRFGSPDSAFWRNLTPEDLYDPAGRKGWDRLDAQYWRANTTPWERYALSLPGTIEHRLRPDGRDVALKHDPEFHNLAFAGDWTYTSINAGSFEAAVMSGIDAAATLIERFGNGHKAPVVTGPPWRHPIPPR